MRWLEHENLFKKQKQCKGKTTPQRLKISKVFDETPKAGPSISLIFMFIRGMLQFLVKRFTQLLNQRPFFTQNSGEAINLDARWL